MYVWASSFDASPTLIMFQRLCWQYSGQWVLEYTQLVLRMFSALQRRNGEEEVCSVTTVNFRLPFPATRIGRIPVAHIFDLLEETSVH